MWVPPFFLSRQNPLNVSSTNQLEPLRQSLVQNQKPKAAPLVSTHARSKQRPATMAPKAEKEYTMEEVSKHNTQDDCWLVIGNESTGGPKVYDVTSYLDDHPGGAEVMLDVGGQDADEFFEDIGHSNDAREELEKHLIGVLKLDDEEKKRRAAAAEKAAAASGGGANVFLILAVLLAVGFGYYKTQMAPAE